MLYKPHFLYRIKLIFIYIFIKIPFLQILLPKDLSNNLPRGWNNKMFWTAFLSGGTRVYFEYYCKLQNPSSYEPKITTDKQYKLTQDHIRSFYEKGYLGPFDLISSNDIKDIRDHIKTLVAKDSKIFSYSRGDYELKSHENRKSFEELSENEKYYINLLNGFERHLEDSIYLNLFKHPAIIERIAQIMGSDLTLWHCNHFRVKPHSPGTDWHQETRWLSFDMKESVLDPIDEEDMFEVNCWIALTDAPEERACLALVSGTHKETYPMKLNKSPALSGDKGIAYGRYDMELAYQVNPEDIQALPAKAGQFYLFSGRALHGSTANVTDKERWAVGGHYVKGDTGVFSQRMLENGLDHEVYGMRSINIENWKPINVRGNGDEAKQSQ